MAATKRAAAQRELREHTETAPSAGRGAVRESGQYDPDFMKSRPFGAPEGTFERPALDWDQLTLGGKPIPEHQRGLIPYDLTDQAKAERAAKRTHEPSGVEFGADPLDKSVRKYADGMEAGTDQWANPDPLKATADKHLNPGERVRFLSPRKIDRSGMRGWEPKLDANGKMVQVGQMIMGTMPESVGQSRDKFYRNKAEDAMVRATETEREETERAIDKTLGRRRRGMAVDKGFESFRGDPAQMEDADFALEGIDRDTK